MFEEGDGVSLDLWIGAEVGEHWRGPLRSKVSGDNPVARHFVALDGDGAGRSRAM